MKTAKNEHELYRVESVPPPEGDDVYDKETAIAAWPAALEQARRASNLQATSKLGAFDLAATLAREAAYDEEADVTSSGTRRRAPSGSLDEVVVEEVTIDVDEERANAAPVVVHAPWRFRNILLFAADALVVGAIIALALLIARR